MSLHLTIRSPSKTYYKGPVERVCLPGRAGSFEVRSGHAALIALVEVGIAKITTTEKTQTLKVTAGVAQVIKDRVHLLLWK